LANIEAGFIRSERERGVGDVYEIRNSQRVLQNILNEIELRYKKQFTGADSAVIFQISEVDQRKIVRYGYAKNEEEAVVIFS
jgi:hypothetical protein